MNALDWAPVNAYVDEYDGASVSASAEGAREGSEAKEYVPFTDDELEEEEYAREAHDGTGRGECPLCDVQDSGEAACSSHVNQILTMEMDTFGKVPDVRTFADIASVYNDEVVEPNARHGRHLRRWNRVHVRNHFDKCRIVPRRRAAQVLKRASNIMDLTYKRCKQRDTRNGDVTVDQRHASSYFNQATKYMQFLRDYRVLTGTDANGNVEATGGARAAVKKSSGIDTQVGEMENGLLYHFSERRLES